MPVLVTGANGQLGHDLCQVFSEAGFQVIGTNRQTLDLEQPEQIIQKIEQLQPKIIIHAAADTNVDQCEAQPERAFLVNALATRSIAVAAAKVGAKLVYFSTDYVFNGTKGVPYREWDTPAPMSSYGHSKWVGEEMVKSFAQQWFIVRTSWVFGTNGRNFIKTILNAAQEKESLQIVSDQLGSPTFSLDLAKFALELTNTQKYGIYHCTNTGYCSWYDLAKFALEERQLHIKLERTDTASLGRPAPRPLYSVLDNYVSRIEGFNQMPPWQEAVRRFLDKIK